MNLHAAHAPFQQEVSGCCCDPCIAVTVAAAARTRFTRWRGDHPDAAADRAYWSAISDRLRILAAGLHARREHDDWVASLPPPQRMPGGGQITGRHAIGVGTNPQLDVWSSPPPAAAPTESPGPGVEGDQFTIFDAA